MDIAHLTGRLLCSAIVLHEHGCGGLALGQLGLLIQLYERGGRERAV
jgi:hypothetical protein